MPIYEYVCDSCGEHLEKLQKISDEPLKECPACSKASLKRIISRTSFQLKGSGWYETDFKNKPSSTPAASKTKTSESSSESSSSPAPAAPSNTADKAKD